MFGTNLPAPLQVALVETPPKEPANCAAGLLEQSVWFGPALAVATGLIVIVIVADAAGQDPPGLSVVRVTVALPAVISVAVGV